MGRPAIQQDLALVQPVHARDTFDQRRLAGAVVAEKGSHLTPPGIHRHVPQCMDRAESLFSIADGEGWNAHVFAA